MCKYKWVFEWKFVCARNVTIIVYAIFIRNTPSLELLDMCSRCCALVPDVTAPDFATVLGRVVLGEVVGKVVGSGSPGD